VGRAIKSQEIERPGLQLQQYEYERTEMADKINLSWDDIRERAETIAVEIKANLGKLSYDPIIGIKLYGIPRGGIYAAQAVLQELQRLNVPCVLMEKDQPVHVYIDDIIDTGATANRYQRGNDTPFYALVDKQGRDIKLNKWISFPWERMTNDDGPVENIRRLLEFIGEDLNRDGLKETPERVIKSFGKLFGGYEQVPEDVIKVFDDRCDEMVIVKDIEFFSTCEHHMLPFHGKAHIAYIPDGKVIGVSKLVRILEIYSRRLQIQERICQQVTQAIDSLLKPHGAACVLEAQHFCMTARGVEKQNSIMVTSSLTGVFRDKPEARSEFMSMIK